MSFGRSYQSDGVDPARAGIMPTSARIDAGWRFRIKMMLQDDSEGRHQLASTRAGDFRRPTSARIDAGWRFRIKMMLQDDSEAIQ
jgi:deoxycytidine triphosphate deaminase